MSSDLLNQVIQKDSPELIAMLHELQESMKEINSKLKPVLVIIKGNSHPPKKLANLPIFQKNGKTFIEMKQNLLLTYCTFLTFYLLLKVESPITEATSHPVTYKLAQIKTLLENLQPMDEKVQQQIDYVLKMDMSKLEKEDQIVDESEGDDNQMMSDDFLNEANQKIEKDQFDDEAPSEDDGDLL